jgi:nucleoside-diphosphate-sugar epimerase
LGDGSQRRDLTHVSDVVRAIESAVRLDHQGATTINVGTGESHSVLDMLEGVKQQAKSVKPTPAPKHLPAHPADVPETRASLVKSRNLLGWTPQIRFPHGPLTA